MQVSFLSIRCEARYLLYFRKRSWILACWWNNFFSVQNENGYFNFRKTLAETRFVEICRLNFRSWMVKYQILMIKTFWWFWFEFDFDKKSFWWSKKVLIFLLLFVLMVRINVALACDFPFDRFCLFYPIQLNLYSYFKRT